MLFARGYPSDLANPHAKRSTGEPPKPPSLVSMQLKLFQVKPPAAAMAFCASLPVPGEDRVTLRGGGWRHIAGMCSEQEMGRMNDGADRDREGQRRRGRGASLDQTERAYHVVTDQFERMSRNS